MEQGVPERDVWNLEGRQKVKESEKPNNNDASSDEQEDEDDDEEDSVQKANLYITDVSLKPFRKIVLKTLLPETA